MSVRSTIVDLHDLCFRNGVASSSSLTEGQKVVLLGQKICIRVR